MQLLTFWNINFASENINDLFIAHSWLFIYQAVFVQPFPSKLIQTENKIQ